MRFTLQNAEKPLQCMELQEKRTKGLKHTGNRSNSSSSSYIKFKFKSQFQLLPQTRCLIRLIVDSSIISIDNNITYCIISSGRSLMYIRKSVGPRIEP